MQPHELFRTKREQIGLTPLECATMLGVDVKTIRRWERDPSKKTSRAVHPTALRVICWMAEPGRPSAWPRVPKRKVA
jgi:DNA-binding transcriptional regulator YiaG